jgi:radical SAM-linked protein
MERIRVTYAKTEPLRYVGNLDMQKVWERSLRRAHLPVAYSQGYHPQPRLNQACPLPLGMTSRHEMVDFWLTEELPADQVRQMLFKGVPPGIELADVGIVDLSLPSLQTQVKSSEYMVELLDPISPQELQDRISNLLGTASIIRTRRDKAYDLRPLVEELEMSESDEGSLRLRMLLAAREGATGRAEEVLAALDLYPSAARVERVKLVL